MRRRHRIVLAATLVALASLLAGCEGFDTEKFDIFGMNDKQKLKGERKQLFPEGVPGVTQGLPPEYLRKDPTSGADRPVGSMAGDLARAPNAQAAATPTEEEQPAPAPDNKSLFQRRR
jgi:hypothetical protein